MAKFIPWAVWKAEGGREGRGKRPRKFWQLPERSPMDKVWGWLLRCNCLLPCRPVFTSVSFLMWTWHHPWQDTSSFFAAFLLLSSSAKVSHFPVSLLKHPQCLPLRLPEVSGHASVGLCNGAVETCAEIVLKHDRVNFETKNNASLQTRVNLTYSLHTLFFSNLFG